MREPIHKSVARSSTVKGRRPPDGPDSKEPGRVATIGSQLQSAARFGHRWSELPARPEPDSAPPLRVGPVDDRFEQQADRLAERMAAGMAGRGEAVQPVNGNTGAVSLQRESAATAAEGGISPPDVATQVAEQHGKGERLPARVRHVAERTLQRDLGDVRVHRDSDSAALSRRLGARAFTVGRDIFLGREAHGRPETMFHEIVHTTQQEASLDSGGSGWIQREPEDVDKRMRRFFPGRDPNRKFSTYDQIAEQAEDVELRNFPMESQPGASGDAKWRTTGQGQSAVGSDGAADCRLRVAANPQSGDTWVQHTLATDPGTAPPEGHMAGRSFKGAQHKFGVSGAAINPKGEMFVEGVQGSHGQLSESEAKRERVLGRDDPSWDAERRNVEEFNWASRDKALQGVHRDLSSHPIVQNRPTEVVAENKPADEDETGGLNHLNIEELMKKHGKPRAKK